jgi:hypothetical protein
MLTRSEMIKANVDQLASLIAYIDCAVDNCSVDNQFPRLYTKGFICPQELNIEVIPGIVAQLPLNSAYFDLKLYIENFLVGAQVALNKLRAEYYRQVDLEAGGTGQHGPIGDLPSSD